MNGLLNPSQKKSPVVRLSFLHNKSLAMTYFRMGKPQTIIGAEHFHFWVRDGIRWFLFAIVARQNWYLRLNLLQLSTCSPNKWRKPQDLTIVSMVSKLNLNLLKRVFTNTSNKFVLKSLFQHTSRYTSVNSTVIHIVSRLVILYQSHTTPKTLGCYMVKPHG